MTPRQKYCNLVFHRLEVGLSSRIGTARFVQFRCPRTIFVPEGDDPHVKLQGKTSTCQWNRGYRRATVQAHATDE